MGLMERLEKNIVSGTAKNESETTTVQNSMHDYCEIRSKAHLDIIKRINKDKNLGIINNCEDSINDMVKQIINDAVSNYDDEVNITEKHKLSHELYDEVIGLGPLERLLADDSISEIMVNGPKQVYIEKNGKILLTDVTFRDNDHVLNIIDKIVAPIGRHVDEAVPMVDARLKDGSRVNAIINPISLTGPVVTIRRFSKNPLTISDLLRYNALSFSMSSFLEACVKGRMNIIVSGGTGSGKTTLLNVLSGFIPEGERIITIEDAAELRLQQKHVITLESRPPNLEGKGQISIRDLVRNALRMRPDRIVVGEVRGGETLDMLQAMNTGHDGSLTTAHANSPRDLLSRLETMVLMSGLEMPIKAIREQVSSAIDLVVQQARLPDGSRKIVSISEITGMEGDTIVTQEIFLYNHAQRKFHATGAVPQFMPKLTSKGIYVDGTWFSHSLE